MAPTPSVSRRHPGSSPLASAGKTWEHKHGACASYFWGALCRRRTALKIGLRRCVHDQLAVLKLFSLECRICRPLYQTFQNERSKHSWAVLVRLWLSLFCDMSSQSKHVDIRKRMFSPLFSAKKCIWCFLHWCLLKSVYNCFIHWWGKWIFTAMSAQVPCRPGRSLNCARAGWRSFEVGPTNCHPLPPWLLKPCGDLMSRQVRLRKCKYVYVMHIKYLQYYTHIYRSIDP